MIPTVRPGGLTAHPEQDLQLGVSENYFMRKDSPKQSLFSGFFFLSFLLPSQVIPRPGAHDHLFPPCSVTVL